LNEKREIGSRQKWRHFVPRTSLVSRFIVAYRLAWRAITVDAEGQHANAHHRQDHILGQASSTSFFAERHVSASAHRNCCGALPDAYPGKNWLQPKFEMCLILLARHSE
jgi:hypothetical protein